MMILQIEVSAEEDRLCIDFCPELAGNTDDAVENI